MIEFTFLAMCMTVWLHDALQISWWLSAAITVFILHRVIVDHRRAMK